MLLEKEMWGRGRNEAEKYCQKSMYRERCIIRQGAGPRPRGFDDLGVGGRGVRCKLWFREDRIIIFRTKAWISSEVLQD